MEEDFVGEGESGRGYFVCDALLKYGCGIERRSSGGSLGGFWAARVTSQSVRRISVNDQKYCDAAAIYLLPCGYHGIRGNRAI
jgi:hypothetical protein